jgi:MATE family multidrug resistance protein
LSTPDHPSLGKELRGIIRLGIPVIITQLLSMSLGVTDVIMSGRLSAEALAAVAVGNAILMPLYLFNLGLLMAVNPIVAQLYGADQQHRIGNKLRQGIWMALIAAVPAFFILREAQALMGFFDVVPAVVPIAERYLDAIALGIPFCFVFLTLRFFNEALDDVIATSVITLLAMFVNIGGNYVLMYGKFGFPELGAVGIGYTTAIVYFVLMLGMIWRVSATKGKSLDLFQWCKPQWDDLREIFAIGAPNGTSLAMETSMFAAIALMVGSLGTTEMAGHQIAINIASVVFMVPLGLSIALTIRVGQAAGARNLQRIVWTGKSGLGLSLAIMTVSAGCMLLVPHFWVGLYTEDSAVIELAVGLLFYAALFQLSDGLQVVFTGCLRGLKDTRIPMFSNMFSYWGVGLPTAYLLGIHGDWGVGGFWIGLLCGLTTAAVLHVSRFVLLVKRMGRPD